MDTSLQNTNLTEDELTVPVLEDQDADLAEAEEATHIHLPNGSLWPLLVGLAILVCMIGFAIINTTPWVTIIGAVFVLVGILGWASENPNASHEEVVEPGKYAATFAEAAKTGKPTPLAEIALQEAEDVVDKTVTIGTTAWSAHPVKVELEKEIENEGVVLALYGKVELEAQRQELEDAVREVPFVVDVHNYITAEDAILNIANARLENLRSQGKLDGAKDLSILV